MDVFVHQTCKFTHTQWLTFTAITSEGTIQLPDGTRVQATSPTGHIVQVCCKVDTFVVHMGTNWFKSSKNVNCDWDMHIL